MQRGRALTTGPDERDESGEPPRATSHNPVIALLRRAAIDVTPLRHEHFRRIFTGNAVATIGFQLTAVAVPVQVYGIRRSTFDVGLLGAVALVPLIVFGLWGGAVADAVERRMLLIIASVMSWLCTVGLLAQAVLGTGTGNLLLILVLTAVQSGAFAVTSSVRGAIIPRVLPVESVPAGNTLEFTTSNLATVAGPLLAGVVLARWSYAAAYGVDAVLFAFALYAAVRLPRLEPTGATSSPGLRSVIDGLRFIASKPVLGLSFAVDIAAMLAMPRALFPAAAERFGGGSAVGWLYASISIGSVIAGLSGGWIGRVRRQGVALVLAVVAWGLAVAASGLAGNLALAVALLAVAGAADLVSAVYRQTILQTYAPDEMRGRLQGVFIVVVTGGPRLGDLRAGAAASMVGVTASWAWGGLVCAVLVTLALLSSPLRHYDAKQTAAANRS